jgi:signal peptidase II
MNRMRITAWYNNPLFWLILLIDRISKRAAFNFLIQRPVHVADFLTFECSKNYGISWGFLSSHNFYGYIAIVGMTLLVLLVLAKYTTDKQRNGYSVLGEMLIIVGGFSNFLDRFSYGAVIDFIKITFFGRVFPTFNIADIAISVGVLIMIHQYFFEDENS